MDPVTVAADVSPLLIGGEILAALVAALLLDLGLRRTLPPPRRAEEGPEARPAAPTAGAAAVGAPPQVGAPSVLGLLRDALGRSREVLQQGLDRVLGRPLDAAATEELEEVLLRADVGVPTTERLLATVRSAGRDTNLREALRREMASILKPVHQPFAPLPDLWVVLIVGVNGSGKTTTIGKLASRLRAEGRKVLVAAGDTYRAAAEQQLGVWAERAGVDLVALDEGADPGAVAYKAVERARAEGHDVVLVDTAGRLQTRKPLMEELGKIRRVLGKALPDAPHETLLVLDGTMGQNGMSQAKLFHEATPLTGVVVTKLDGTAKGGMILAIANELRLPVKLVGLGEKVGDLRDFDPDAFVDALL